MDGFCEAFGFFVSMRGLCEFYRHNQFDHKKHSMVTNLNGSLHELTGEDLILTVELNVMAWAVDNAVAAYVGRRLGQLSSGVGVSYKTPRAGETPGETFQTYNTPDSFLASLKLVARKYDVVGKNRRDTVVSVSVTRAGEEVTKAGYTGDVLSKKLLDVVRAGSVTERADCPDRIVELDALVEIGALGLAKDIDRRRGRVPRNIYTPTQIGLDFIKELEDGLVDGTDSMLALAEASHPRVPE